MNIKTIIEKYEGKILDDEEYEELCFEQCVERIEWNGRSGCTQDYIGIQFIS